jgi:hypothetical protein
MISFKIPGPLLFRFLGATERNEQLTTRGLANNTLLTATYFALYRYLQYMAPSLSVWRATPLGAVQVAPRGAFFVPGEIVSGSASQSIVWRHSNNAPCHCCSTTHIRGQCLFVMYQGWANYWMKLFRVAKR